MISEKIQRMHNEINSLTETVKRLEAENQSLKNKIIKLEANQRRPILGKEVTTRCNFEG